MTNIRSTSDRLNGRRPAATWLAWLLVGAATVAGQPVPPPVPQLRADCTRPQYASDMLVCGDVALAAIDAEVAALAGTPPTLGAGAIWEDQAAWLRRRSLCAFQTDHRGCLVAAYADRRSVLAAATLPSTQPLRCTGTWRGRTLRSSAIKIGQAIALREDGKLLGVGTSAIAPSWQPALAWRAAGRGITLQAQGGKAFQCRPATE